MNFHDLLTELDELNLPTDQYAITSSGTLAVRGLREAADLDIIVTPELWKKLSSKYEVIYEGDFQTIIIGNVQILGSGSWFTSPQLESPQEQILKADLIENKRYVNLGTIKLIKTKRNKPKDLIDIILIEIYLNQITN